MSIKTQSRLVYCKEEKKSRSGDYEIMANISETSQHVALIDRVRELSQYGMALGIIDSHVLRGSSQRSTLRQ